MKKTYISQITNLSCGHAEYPLLFYLWSILVSGQLNYVSLSRQYQNRKLRKIARGNQMPELAPAWHAAGYIAYLISADKLPSANSTV